MNRKIEVGCLVMVVASRCYPERVGSVGAVVDKTSNGYIHGGRRNSFDCNYAWVCKGIGRHLTYHNPAHLLRIDDYTEETEAKEEEMVV